MSELVTDLFSLIGLFLTLIGAGVAAWAVILRPEDAVKIGVSRFAGGTFEENLKLPTVQNLLKSSRWAKRGLILVGCGTALQAAPIVFRLIHRIDCLLGHLSV